MDGWQAVASIAIGGIVACFLAYTGHETIAAAIGGSIVTGVFSLLTQLKRIPSSNGRHSDPDAPSGDSGPGYERRTR